MFGHKPVSAFAPLAKYDMYDSADSKVLPDVSCRVETFETSISIKEVEENVNDHITLYCHSRKM